MNTPFRFKQFSIQQDKCAMKVGTDGVLLGAWTSLEDNPYAILDIGAGTGLISLMLAQRSQATIIDAIEIDAEAYEQCVANFEQSIWNDRLFCYHAGLDEFVDEIEDQYDLIVSNPHFILKQSLAAMMHAIWLECLFHCHSTSYWPPSRNFYMKKAHLRL